MSNINRYVLQCGRIYKDAEIDVRGTGTHSDRANLQCGRIYKDAEMHWQRMGTSSLASLQCGRIYKDAEISGPDGFGMGFLQFLKFCRIYKDAEIHEVHEVAPRVFHTFNVAASIKMRK